MTPQRETLNRLREQARHARAHGHFAQAARLERRAVEWATAAGLIGERTRALLWEGYSLSLAGEDDLALAALLQAANERAMTADPADIFSALMAIVHISLDRKPASFCRALLEQGRGYLEAIQQPWTALLDYLDGELAYRQGDFATAWACHGRAWAGRRETHPRLTAATHLWALCRIAFRRRDRSELERRVGMLNALAPTQALERALLQRAQWWLWRAQRATLPFSEIAPAPIAAARSLLDEDVDRMPWNTGTRQEALRILALAGCWQELDRALSRYSSPADSFEDSFETLLLLGDLALNRARAILGMPVVDDEYGEFVPASSASSASPGTALSASSVTDEATRFIKAAQHHYQRLQQWAEREDTRLETQWYHAVFSARVAAVQLIGGTVSS